MLKRIFARSRLVLFLLLVLAGLPPRAAVAEEYIQSFDAVIDLARDSSMTVTETIKVNAEGQEIRRGIFRDFPLTFLDARGRRATVEFQVLSVERDGETENWRSESISGGIRIYIGKAEVMLDSGEHSFQITYRTSRQIRFFPDHDELFWNVTGNGWAFRIDQATATVSLPDGARATDLTFFTGPSGAKDKNARVSDDGSEVFFATTQALQPHEGLTIGVKLAKGVLDAPTAAQESGWFFSDNLVYFIGFGGFVAVFAYYLYSWVKVGRDPPRGVMVPRWDAPDGISPGLVNYIDNKGFAGQGWTALSATALSLAVGGSVTLQDLEKSIVIKRTDKGKPQKLDAGEASLLAQFSGADDTIVIDKAHGEEVQDIGRKFRAAVEKEHRNRYYKSNGLYIFGGIALSVLTFFAVLMIGNLSEEGTGILVGSVIIAAVVGFVSIPLALKVRSSRSILARIALILVLAIFLFVGLILVFGLLVAAYIDLADHREFALVVAVGGIVLINILFFFLMGAPTPIGSKMMDGIDGLRQYLTLAEKDRMNMAGVPTMSPQHFETLLPYAVALGVEKPWSATFEKWLALAAAGAAAANYQPAWYAGTGFTGSHFGDRIGGFSSSMASTIASTIPAPVSSSSSGFSSGGGSSSGGGGGGGGGGGW